MLWFIIVGVIIVIVIATYRNNRKGKNTVQPVPPSEDVNLIGCYGDCGYFIPEFHKNARGDYDADEKMCFCKYQNKTIAKGSKCPYAKDHPDKLRPSLFDD